LEFFPKDNIIENWVFSSQINVLLDFVRHSIDVLGFLKTENLFKERVENLMKVLEDKRAFLLAFKELLFVIDSYDEIIDNLETGTVESIEILIKSFLHNLENCRENNIIKSSQKNLELLKQIGD